MKKSKDNATTNPVEVAVNTGKVLINDNTIVIVNGKRIDPKEISALVIQYASGALVVELNYTTKNASKVPTTKKVIDEKPGPSIKGIDVIESKDPEIYTLKEENLLKLAAMSALRTPAIEDGKTISKLRSPLDDPKKYSTSEKEVTTSEYNITEIPSISSALNDLAVQEQKIQRDPKVVKVEELLSPQISIVGDIFHLVEKFKLYTVKE